MSHPYKTQCQIFSPEQIASLRKGGKILHDCLRHTAAFVTPGITTGELDTIAEEFIRDRNALPAFKGYRNFPATLCTSVNDVCVHGMPGKEELSEGDIISIDCGVLLDDLYTDSCITVPVGSVSDDTQKLLDATEKALTAGLRTVHAGARTNDISKAVHASLVNDGFDTMRQLTGHGLGETLHQFPEIFNFPQKKNGPKLPANTIIAIEPISTAGSVQVKEDSDGWTLRTTDGALSGHFEHTVLVTEEGCEVLT